MASVAIDRIIRTRFGKSLEGVEMYVYERGTTDEVVVYSDAEMSSPVSQPLLSNVEGCFPGCWVEGSQSLDTVCPQDAIQARVPWEAIAGDSAAELQAALDAISGGNVTLNDDFARIDGPLGVDPMSGYLWSPTGTAPPILTSGALVNSVANGVGYAITRMDTKPVEVGGTFSLHPGGGTDAASCTIVVASGSADLQNLVHPDFTQTGWVIQKRVNGSWTILASGTWATPLAHDGTIYSYGWRLDDETITVTWPDGTISEVTDPDLATLHSAVCFWEIVEQANSPLGKWRTAHAKEVR